MLLLLLLLFRPCRLRVVYQSPQSDPAIHNTAKLLCPAPHSPNRRGDRPADYPRPLLLTSLITVNVFFAFACSPASAIDALLLRAHLDATRAWLLHTKLNDTSSFLKLQLRQSLRFSMLCDLLDFEAGSVSWVANSASVLLVNERYSCLGQSGCEPPISICVLHDLTGRSRKSDVGHRHCSAQILCISDRSQNGLAL